MYSIKELNLAGPSRRIANRSDWCAIANGKSAFYFDCALDSLRAEPGKGCRKAWLLVLKERGVGEGEAWTGAGL